MFGRLFGSVSFPTSSLRVGKPIIYSNQSCQDYSTFTDKYVSAETFLLTSVFLWDVIIR